MTELLVALNLAGAVDHGEIERGRIVDSEPGDL